MKHGFWRGVALIVSASLMTPLLVGCSAFQNRAVSPVADVSLKGGGRIGLSWDVRSESSKQTKRVMLWMDADDDVTKYETVVAADVAKDDLALRTDAEHRRAWVLDRRQNAVLLSVDFQNEQAWKDQNDQPEWAIRE